jgi:hypothetical protein
MAIDVAVEPLMQAAPSLRVAGASESFDRDYWIAHCEGYRVDGHAGRIGFVEEVRPNPADPRSPLLAIRAGRLGRRIVVVPADEVHSIVPRSERIWLRAPVSIVTSEAA